MPIIRNGACIECGNAIEGCECECHPPDGIATPGAPSFLAHDWFVAITVRRCMRCGHPERITPEPAAEGG